MTRATRGGHIDRAIAPDLAIANTLRVLAEIQQAGLLSRAEISRRTGLAPPTISRLVNRLIDRGLVRDTSEPPNSTLGRPAVLVEIVKAAAHLLACDVGNESTRVALAGLDGRIVAVKRTPTTGNPYGLVERIVRLADTMRSGESSPLAGVAVGVAAVAERGVLRDPPQHPDWNGYPLGAKLRDALGAPVVVEQDDHLAALAEAGPAGTAAGASSVVVLQIGKGIGVGYCLEGEPVSGAGGRFGRIAQWPLRLPLEGLQRRTLGDLLTSRGMARLYAINGGRAELPDGRAVVEAADGGDKVAREVVVWVGRELAALVRDLDAILAPDVIVLGGGLSAGFASFAPIIGPLLPARIDLRPSSLGDRAVLVGGMAALAHEAEHYVVARISEVALTPIRGHLEREDVHHGPHTSGVHS